MRGKGARRFQQIKRLVGGRRSELCRKLVKIVPQADHLAWFARRADAHVGQRDAPVGGSGAGEHVALKNLDHAILQGSEFEPVVVVESQPLHHDLAPH